MTPAQQTAAFLRHFNEWRRGEHTGRLPVPTEVGQHIDIAVEILEDTGVLDRVEFVVNRIPHAFAMQLLDELQIPHGGNTLEARGYLANWIEFGDPETGEEDAR